MLSHLDLAGVGPTLDRQMLAKGPWLAPRPSGGHPACAAQGSSGDRDTAVCSDFLSREF